ncbi:Hypothetical predicted protein [Mytilus galloprovincialis]|uniref:Uncharacterized protein n=1 Tax=Mytilus galloprovincialis TaxID=29158 RepID=A0A8B6GT49_MYTGA|nr:Hypothetical predicted protein [Mytilus galloprovincialis]
MNAHMAKSVIGSPPQFGWEERKFYPEPVLFEGQMSSDFLQDLVYHITQNLSTELYRYMCQSIVGTEDNVKQIRLMNAIRDDLSIHKNEISITSGSYGEGLDMRGSDLDVMYVVQNIKVYDVKPRLNPISAYLLMDTDNVKPGFTQLRLDSRCTSYHTCVQLGDKYYLSSSLWKEDILTKNMDYTIHGPCVSDKDGLYDFAECLHCKSWISSAVQWITRSTNSWPSNNVKQSIIKHGVLFVPIGTKGSTKRGFRMENIIFNQ